MKLAALELGEPAAEYDDDIAMFSHALQTHAWDEESGYFGYVRHDDDGRPAGILRHESGANFDMGLDGAYPLVAGICTPAQEQRLLSYLTSDGRMWCRCGISTVDQTRALLPQRRLLERRRLDAAPVAVLASACSIWARADDAFRIAGTALEVWKSEVEASYNCFEHFIVQTGRGAGWHQFGGLSSPVLYWYGSYYRPGRLTTGLEVWVESLSFAAGERSLSAG